MSIMLTIDNSYSRISGLTQEDLRALRKVLSYRIDFASARFIPNPANHVKYVIDLKGNFGTGLLYQVEAFCKIKGLVYAVNDLRKPTNLPTVPTRAFKSTNTVKPYQDQDNAVNAAVEATRGIISMPTGSGKSQVIAMLVERTKLRTLIIVPTVELKAQLTASLKAALTTMESILVENIDSTSLKKATDFDCLIIDESHHVAAKTYHKLNKSAWGKIRSRYFFTATPFRNNSEETLLFESIAGKVIYELTYSEAVSKGYIVPIESYYYELPKVKTDAFTYAQVYSELVVNNEFRNNLIALLLLRLNAQGKATICLVKEIKHGEILSDLTGIPFVNGQDEESRQYIQQFNSGKLKCLIGTTGVLGEGIDSRPAEFIIIASPGKAKSQFMQQCGRGVRKYPGKESAKIILIKDRSHKFLIRHFNAQHAILVDEYDNQPTKMELE